MCSEQIHAPFWHPKHWNNAVLWYATLQKQQVSEGKAELIAPLQKQQTYTLFK